MNMLAPLFSADALFNVASLFMLLGAGITVFSRNPMHSLLGLLLAFIQAAILCIAMGAPFFGLLLVMIYVGAIAVMFLFVIMTVRFDETLKPKFSSVFLGSTLGGIVLIELYFALRLTMPIALQQADPAFTPTLTELGLSMFNEHVVELQVVALTLLVAMVGAIVLVARTKISGVRTQKPSQQTQRVMGVKLVNGGKR